MAIRICGNGHITGTRACWCGAASDRQLPPFYYLAALRGQTESVPIGVQPKPRLSLRVLFRQWRKRHRAKKLDWREEV